jgi:hypothetical protein
MSFSLRGVARKYAGITTGFSVINQIFGVPQITGTVSLRSKLQSMSRQEHSFGLTECIFAWTAAFEQTWSHIRIRIQLDPEQGIPPATMNNLMTLWQNGIVNTWSNRWGCGRLGELTCPFEFEVLWVIANPHHTVTVHQGSGRANMSNWYTTGSGGVAAHEFGHMLGQVDEYYENPPCPNRNPVNTGTVMDNNSNNVPARMMSRFANNIGSDVVGI